MSAAPHPFDTARENASDTNSVTGGGGGGGGGGPPPCRKGPVISYVYPVDPSGATLGREVQPTAVRAERGAGDLGAPVVDDATEGGDVGGAADVGKDPELHVPSVLGDEDVPGRCMDGDVVDGVERARDGHAVVEDRDRAGDRVEPPDALVTLGREVHGIIAGPDPLATVEGGRRRLSIGSVRRRGDPRHDRPRHGRRVEGPAAEDAGGGGDELVQPSCGVVLGEVEMTRRSVDRHGLVVERTERRTLHAFPRTERLAFVHSPDPAVLLTRQPSPPGSGTSRAIASRVGENPIGVDDRAVGRELHG